VLKYTTNIGGAQDNQFNDVKFFMWQIVGFMNDVTYAGERFIFFLDGLYYSDEKIVSLKEMIPKKSRSKIAVMRVQQLK
jgi:hypothetical protein